MDEEQPFRLILALIFVLAGSVSAITDAAPGRRRA